MGSYTQWRVAADRGDHRKVTWVCGEESVLREEIVAEMKTLAGPGSANIISLLGGTTPDRSIWEHAHQYQMSDEPRLVLVRGADKITNWAPLRIWLDDQRNFPKTYLLFVSEEPEFPHVKLDGRKTELKEHVSAIQLHRGRLVKCSMPNERDAVAWVRRTSPSLDQELALYLLTRLGGDLSRIMTVCQIVNSFPGMRVTRQALDSMCSPWPGVDFVAAVLEMRKPEALMLAELLSSSEVRRVIGQLDARLDHLIVLNEAIRTQKAFREIQGVPGFLIRQLLPIAKRYDIPQVRRDRQVLALIDDAARSGATDGVLQALITLW